MSTTTTTRPAVRVEVILLPYTPAWLRFRMRVLTAAGDVVCKSWDDDRATALKVGKRWARANNYPLIREG